MAYIMDTNEEERAKVPAVFWLMFLRLVKLCVPEDRIHVSWFDRVKQLKLEGLILKLRTQGLPFWMLR